VRNQHDEKVAIGEAMVEFPLDGQLEHVPARLNRGFPREP
jgi:hypothetical protein